MPYLAIHLNDKTMKEQLEQEQKELQKALKSGYLTTNEYCDLYHALAKKIKAL